MSQSLDGEALDKAKQQLKLAVKRGYGTILERFDNDVDYTMHAISAGYDLEFLPWIFGRCLLLANYCYDCN